MAIYDKAAGHDGMQTRGVTTGHTVVNAQPLGNTHFKGTVIDPPAGKHAEFTHVWVQWNEDSAQQNVPLRQLTKL